MRPMGERKEMPGGTLRVDSKPGAGARLKKRVPLYGCKVWRIGLRLSVYAVSGCNVLGERTCEARLSASVGL